MGDYTRIFKGSDAEMTRIPDLINRISRELEKQQTPKPPSNGETNEYEYNFHHPYRGLAVVCSNGRFDTLGPRGYARKDVELMSSTLQTLGFMVMKFQDLKRSQILDVLKCVSELTTIHGQSDAFACAIGSHGNEILQKRTSDPVNVSKLYEHAVYGTDTYIATAEILKIFSDKKCKAMRGKPRMFFIQVRSLEKEMGKPVLAFL